MKQHHVSKEEKLYRIAKGLVNVPWQQYNNHPTIDRQQLREVYTASLDISDRHVVNGWIDYTIGLNMLSHNPESQLITKKIPLGLSSKIEVIKMPRDSTRYFINAQKLNQILEQGSKKFDAHTTHLDLSQCSSETHSQDANKRSSSETQEAIKDNSKGQ
jgi:hypothetical protein